DFKSQCVAFVCSVPVVSVKFAPPFCVSRAWGRFHFLRPFHCFPHSFQDPYEFCWLDAGCIRVVWVFPPLDVSFRTASLVLLFPSCFPCDDFRMCRRFARASSLL